MKIAFFVSFLLFLCVVVKAQQNNELAGLFKYITDSIILVHHQKDRMSGGGSPPYILNSKTQSLAIFVNRIDFESEADSVGRFLKLHEDSVRKTINSFQEVDISAFLDVQGNLLLSNYLTSDSVLITRLERSIKKVWLSTPVFFSR